MMYYTGKGVSQDYVQAHTWINLAVSRATTGEAKYFRSLRDSLAERMTASQVAEGPAPGAGMAAEDLGAADGQVDFSVDRVTTELPDFRTSSQNKPIRALVSSVVLVWRAWENGRRRIGWRTAEEKRKWEFGMKHKAHVLNTAILVLVLAAAAAAQSTKIVQLRLDAEQGDAQGQNGLGLMYKTGKGVPQDYQEGMRWYRLAAEQGNDLAQYSLGVMYDTGKGVPQDYVQAHTWINLAASRATTGFAKLFQLQRDSLAERMTASQVAEAQRLAREWQPKTWEQLTGK